MSKPPRAPSDRTAAAPPKAAAVAAFPRPASREPLALLAVDRAVGDLRRGRPVVLRAGGDLAALVLACEAVSDTALAALAIDEAQPLCVAVTHRRALALGLTAAPDRVVVLRAETPLDAERIRGLADPTGGSDADTDGLSTSAAGPFGAASAAVALTRTARLLPAAVVAALDTGAVDDLEAWARRRDLILVDAGDVFQHQASSARTLRLVGEARVPLADAENTRILAFRPHDGGIEHLAIVVGAPDPAQPVLARIHSECFTGDLLGSLRCDCGDQLRGAIREIAAAGGGVLLYLAQEGRGIGLVNKLRAYDLQDRGFDTMDANEMLGFDADERVYLPAVRMFRHLGFDAVRLMTNNPDKVAALEACGLTVADRVPHAFPSNQHNESYLKTKAHKGGHFL
jgi:GTP cyclohydrolase II